MFVVDGDPSDLVAAVGSIAVRSDTGAVYARSDAGWRSAGGFDPAANIDFSGLLKIERAEPRLIFEETDRGTDLKTWDLDVSAGTFAFRTRTDADGAGVSWFSAVRGVTTAVTDVTLAAGTLAGDVLALSGNQVTVSGSGGGIDAVYIRATASTGFVSIEALGVGAHVSVDTTLFQLNTGAIEAYGDSILFANNGGSLLLLDVEDATLAAGGADGDIFLNVAGTGTIGLGTQLGNYANDAAAAIGGIPVRSFYRNGSVVMIRVA